MIMNKENIEKLIELIENEITETEKCEDIEAHGFVTEEFFIGYIEGLKKAKTIVEEKIYLL